VGQNHGQTPPATLRSLPTLTIAIWHFRAISCCTDCIRRSRNQNRTWGALVVIVQATQRHAEHRAARARGGIHCRLLGTPRTRTPTLPHRLAAWQPAVTPGSQRPDRVGDRDRTRGRSSGPRQSARDSRGSERSDGLCHRLGRKSVRRGRGTIVHVERGRLPLAVVRVPWRPRLPAAGYCPSRGSDRDLNRDPSQLDRAYRQRLVHTTGRSSVGVVVQLRASNRLAIRSSRERRVAVRIPTTAGSLRVTRHQRCTPRQLRRAPSTTPRTR
jgi:hypothetical protein